MISKIAKATLFAVIEVVLLSPLIGSNRRFGSVHKLEAQELGEGVRTRTGIASLVFTGIMIQRALGRRGIDQRNRTRAKQGNLLGKSVGN